jgi:alkylhydroperoxidase family enzyme
MHAKAARRSGGSAERLFAGAAGAWRVARYFSDAERAALALAETLTRIADRSNGCPTRSGTPPGSTSTRRSSRAVLDIAAVNLWNRLNIATQQVVGEQSG